MWIGNIGNKCASFINHKFFHPGNKRNLERVWLAEEKEKKRKQEEENYLKKREEQLRMQYLQRMIRKNENESNKKNERDPHSNQLFDDIKKKRSFINETHEEEKMRCVRRNGTQEIKEENETNAHVYIEDITNRKNSMVKSKYKEDVYPKNHKSVYGSYYDKKTKCWGFQCCKNINKNSFCSINENKNWYAYQDRPKGKEGNINVIKTKKEIKKKKKKKKKKMVVDNSITAVLNMIN